MEDKGKSGGKRGPWDWIWGKRNRIQGEAREAEEVEKRNEVSGSQEEAVDCDLLHLQDESRPKELVLHPRMLTDHFTSMYRAGLESHIAKIHPVLSKENKWNQQNRQQVTPTGAAA